MNARFVAILLCCLAFGVQSLEAKVFTGQVTKISADRQAITVYSTAQKTEQSFLLKGRNFKITVNGKTGQLSELEVGDGVTVLTDTAGNPQRLFISKQESSSTKPSSPATGRSGTAQQPPASMKSPLTNSTAGKATSQEYWPDFLGPQGNNQTPETNLLKQWPAAGPALLWTARQLGEGYSSVSVVGDRVYTMGTRQGQEVVLALNLATGQELWSARSGGIFNDHMGNGPRSTPTFDQGKLYCLGANGDLSCLDARSGQVLWQKNILSQFSARNIVWGISESPLVDGDQLICTPGGTGATMVALNKSTGEVLWQAAIPGNPQAGYSTAIAVELNGTRQYVNFCHGGLFGVDASTGQALWGDDNASNTTANCSAALAVGGNAIFYASGYGAGGALLQFNSRQGKPSLAYKTEKMKNHHGGMVEVDGHIYGANENILTCLKAQTGAVAWQDRLAGQGKGAITYADGHLYFRSENGPMYLIEATPEAFRLKGQFDQPERSGKQAWARPVVADGKLFLRDQDLLLCYDLKK